MTSNDKTPNQTGTVDSGELSRLLDAVWQVLDDMGANGTSCCLAAKAQLRVAYEPFHNPELPMDMPIWGAREILRRVSE